VIHREDYHEILLEGARAHGAELRLGQQIVKVDVELNQVLMSDGTVLTGDVIVGADGSSNHHSCGKQALM
jgi:salicylate hydroxylase